MRLGRALGSFSQCLARRRVRIVDVNLKLAFPELDESARLVLRKKIFQSIGMGLFEAMSAWWLSRDAFLKKFKVQYNGLENLRRAQQEGRGVLVCGGHFNCLEIGGRHFAETYPPLDLVYRKHSDPVFEDIMYGRRKQYVAHCIHRDDVRGMVKSLREGHILWYGPDQDFGRERSVFVPFFGVQTATLKATAWLAKAGNAVTIAAFFHRLPNDEGYVVDISPMWENFPTGDEHVDASRYNAMLEAYVRQYPDQYFWQHRRFKTRPEGEPSIY
jgi:KDO2-lipid IV(A) lauroyltransferase